MTIGKIAAAFACTAVSLASASAMAQHVYVVGSVGSSRIDNDCRAAVTCDKRDTAGRFVAGFDIGTGVALELGYIDYGRARFVAAGGEVKDHEVASTQVGFAYQMPMVEGWRLNLRAGMARVTTRLSGSVPGNSASSDKDVAAMPYAGGGLNYAFGPHLKADLGIDFSGADFRGQRTAVRAVLLGLRYDF